MRQAAPRLADAGGQGRVGGEVRQAAGRGCVELSNSPKVIMWASRWMEPPWAPRWSMGT